MSVRMRHTKGHTGNRRSHHALKAINVVKDSDSGNLRLPHRIDEITGMYRGKQIAQPRKEAVSKKTSEEHTSTQNVDLVHNENIKTDTKSPKGIVGKIITGGRPKARSGFGGGS